MRTGAITYRMSAHRGLGPEVGGGILHDEAALPALKLNPASPNERCLHGGPRAGDLASLTNRSLGT